MYGYYWYWIYYTWSCSGDEGNQLREANKPLSFSRKIHLL